MSAKARGRGFGGVEVLDDEKKFGLGVLGPGPGNFPAIQFSHEWGAPGPRNGDRLRIEMRPCDALFLSLIMNELALTAIRRALRSRDAAVIRDENFVLLLLLLSSSSSSLFCILLLPACVCSIFAWGSQDNCGCDEIRCWTEFELASTRIARPESRKAGLGC